MLVVYRLLLTNISCTKAYVEIMIKNLLTGTSRLHILAIASIAVFFASIAPVVQAYSSGQILPDSLVVASSTSITLTQSDKKESGVYGAFSSNNIQTQTELIDFASSLLYDDSYISEINIGAHSVSMTYGSRTLTVLDDGSVSVSRPWYLSLLNTSNTPSLRKGFRGIPMVSDSAGMTPATQARILLRMHGRFQLGVI